MTDRQLIIKERNRRYYQANKTEIKVKYRPGKKQYYKKNKNKIKAASRNRYFKDPEKWKEYGRLSRKIWRQNEKEKLIKETIARVRVKFFDDEFIPEDEVDVKKKRKRKSKKRKQRLVKNRTINPNRVPYGYWQNKYPIEDFKNEVDRQRAIWNAQMKAKGERGYYRSAKYKDYQRNYHLRKNEMERKTKKRIFS